VKNAQSILTDQKRKNKMKITNPNVNIINQAYAIPVQKNQNSLPDKEKTAGQNTVDSVSLSSHTRGLQKLFTAMQTEPKGRSARIAELKTEVSRGQYTVNAEKVAEKMAGYFLNGFG